MALHKLQKFYPIEPGNLQDTANCKYQILFLKWLCHEWIKIKTGIIKRIKNTFSKWHDFLELIIIWMKLHDIKFSRMLSFTRNIWCFYWWFHPNDYLRQLKNSYKLFISKETVPSPIFTKFNCWNIDDNWSAGDI